MVQGGSEKMCISISYSIFNSRKEVMKLTCSSRYYFFLIGFAIWFAISFMKTFVRDVQLYDLSIYLNFKEHLQFNFFKSDETFTWFKIQFARKGIHS